MIIIALTVEILSILLLDIVFNLVFIIGAHKKHTTLLLLCYRYRIAREFVFTASALLYSCLVYKVTPENNLYEESNLWHLILKGSFTSTIFQTFLLILVRWWMEVLKLEANS
ncbi:unnamed protein product [Parnassius apollo]|uniref:(apollo) hypothetical protein n=1 Tax=Parnassius apollo TaxID=110799 RepID=A0A8S3Y0M3_PARAO|nr:unnamed protein product [Parnassius apollo]